MDKDAAASPTTRGTRKHQPTIYDIAQAAGVDASTVSRALNKPGRINVHTEARIRAAAAELGYQGNPMARALPTGKTRTLALILSDLTNPVYFTLLRAAEQTAAAAGYTLVLAESQDSSEMESGISQTIVPAVDGLVLVGSRLDDEQVRSLAQRKPVVVVNRSLEELESVVPDVAPGIAAAVAHLADLGHKSVAYLGGPANAWMSRRRWDEIFEQAVAHGMSVVEIGPNAPTREAGRDAMKRVIASGTTAVIAYNDLMAIGLLDAAKQDGLEVPGRLSIIGFDDIFGADFTSPPLTTVSTELSGAGAEAVRRLLAAIDSKERSAGTDLTTSLVVRESTGAPRG